MGNPFSSHALCYELGSTLTAELGKADDSIKELQQQHEKGKSGQRKTWTISMSMPWRGQNSLLQPNAAAEHLFHLPVTERHG